MSETEQSNESTETGASEEPDESRIAPAPRSGSDISLRSLAPEYRSHQHDTYVSRLIRAVADPRNKNIALTGRYGSGKSSILDHFLVEVADATEASKGKETLRISINTLGPDDDGDLTNRIQKELVKQLIYRTSPGEIRRSRFARTKDLTPWRALLEGLLFAVVLVGLLWLFGIRPEIGDRTVDSVFVPAVALLLLVTVAAVAGRWALGHRIVSQVSTGGTSIQLADEPESYFDKYLDEIMAFFDATEPDIVVFEDLDRFDDPRIFDSLRELNSLINSSSKWAKKSEPLRFIYAIKDSLFEKLGEDSKGKDKDKAELQQADPGMQTRGSDDSSLDPAVAAVERANRTKFFELVIPVVPFLSHSNARDLLSGEITRLELPDGTISRQLIDVVARHTTDMRLLINICNEFVVFAERLLWIERPAPKMTADDLFALVAYKNFHLADFEKLPNRGSMLDTLETTRRETVSRLITDKQKQKRAVSRVNDLQQRQTELAKVLGARLEDLISMMPGRLVQILVGGEPVEVSTVREPTFWKRVADADTVAITTSGASGGYQSRAHLAELTSDRLASLFPEGMESEQWREPDPDGLAAQQRAIDDAVTSLRGADFAELARDSRSDPDSNAFDAEVTTTLTSDLARELVRRGFINRFYAEYSSSFYGSFLGVDVANYFRNCVWPNEMDVNAQFTTPNAARNVIEQAPVGFTNSRSVLNIEVVDHMLAHEAAMAKEVVAFIVAEQSDDTDTFLKAHLNSTSEQKELLVTLLAAHPWSGLLDHLALADSVSDEDVRTNLLDAALLNAQDPHAYDLGARARELIVDRHATLKAFIDRAQAAHATSTWTLAKRAGLIVPELKPLADDVRDLVVEDVAYTLSADNLRAALVLGDEHPVTLDTIHPVESVWERCKRDIETYFDVAQNDVHTQHVVDEAKTLGTIIDEQAANWSKSEVERLLALSAPRSALPDIEAVPQTTWSAIVRAGRMILNIANLRAYIKSLGVDEALAGALVTNEGTPVTIEGVNSAEPEVTHSLVVSILNAGQVLEPGKRVAIARKLAPDPNPGSVNAAEIEALGDDLLAHMLEARMVEDSPETFEHFIEAGWPAVSGAFRRSEAVEEFLTPTLVAGHVRTLLRDQQVPSAIKRRVLKSLDEYTSGEDANALGEGAALAYKSQTKLPLALVERAAGQAADHAHILWQLAHTDDAFDADVAINSLAGLGGVFTSFGGGSGEKVDVPNTPLMGRVLERLKEAGRITSTKGSNRSRLKATLA